jgi:hypothetical protein
MDSIGTKDQEYFVLVLQHQVQQLANLKVAALQQIAVLLFQAK